MADTTETTPTEAPQTEGVSSVAIAIPIDCSKCIGFYIYRTKN